VKLRLPILLSIASIHLFSRLAPAAPVAGCEGLVTRANVVRCVLATSPMVRAEQAELSAAQGRRTAVSPLLPSNPVASFSLAHRREPGGPTAVNWHAALEQELEIAGQRGARRSATGAFVQAQSERVQQRRRDVAAEAWTAYFRAAAAQERQELATRLAEGARAVATVARARADKGLVALVEADVADASAIKAWQAQLSAERARADADATLLALLGRAAGSPLDLQPELEPLQSAALEGGPPAAGFPPVRIREAERQAYERQAEAYRRARIPNPTLSVFAENDGFNEHVLGVGLSLPVPLPGNVGRTFRGEIAEAEALSARAAAERDAALRDATLALDKAKRAFASRAKELQAFTPERLARARESLSAMREEVEAGRLSVRDAVVLQEPLLELLEAELSARLEWCLASVSLGYASGVALEEGVP
jgi:cobalt-zinc-cadmium efflux system outer membrane protein